MELIVSLVGAVIFGIGVFGVLRPTEVGTLLTGAAPNSLFNFAIGARLVIGVLFIAVAPATRIPNVIYIIGGLSILAAVLLPVLGQRRFDMILVWVASRPPIALRLWSLMAALVGGFLVYAGL